MILILASLFGTVYMRPNLRNTFDGYPMHGGLIKRKKESSWVKLKASRPTSGGLINTVWARKKNTFGC